jgi:hypothetical protein
MRPDQTEAMHVRRCPRCADVVGVYERAIWVLRNGSVVDGSSLAIDRAAEVLAAYHPWCAPPETARS